MSVDDAIRGWASRRVALLIGMLMTSGACTEGARQPREVLGTLGPESGAPLAGLELTAAVPDRSSRPKEPSGLVPVSNGPASYPGGAPSGRSVALGAKGTVFVSARDDDKVYALVDDDGDHKVDRVHVVARGLDTLSGIAYREGVLYIAELSRVLRLDGIDTRLDSPPKPVVVSDELPARERHGWRYVRFDADGWLYIPIGPPHQA